MSITINRTNFSHTYMGVRGMYDVSLTAPDYNNATSGRNACPGINLLITLKVNLVQDNTGAAGGSGREWGSTGYHFAPWPATEWSNFQTMFLDCARFWDNKFWLLINEGQRLSDAYRSVEKDMSIIEIVNTDRKFICPMVVNCRFTPQIVSDGTQHYTLNASYLVDASGAPVPRQPGSQYILRSNDSNIDSGDVYAQTVAHEIGHRIGLPHIGEMTSNRACMPWYAMGHFYDGNATACYEGADPRYTNNIMGRGDDIDWRDAVPWRVALQDITGIPLTSYVVHTSRYTSSTFLPEMIDNLTPRWNQFHRSGLSRSFVSRMLDI